MPTTIASTPREPVEVEGRVSFTPAQRRRVLAAYDGCAVCWTDLREQPFEVDHVIPRALGGAHKPSNWQPLCMPCHAAKTAKDRKAIAKAHRIARREAREQPKKQPIRSAGFRRDPLSWRGPR